MNAPATTTGPEIKPAEAAELRRRARACLDLAASSTHPAERDSATTAADRLSSRLIASGYPGVTGCPSEAARLSAQADAKAARRRASKAPQPPPEAGVLAVVSKPRATRQPRHTPRPDLPIPADPPRTLRAWQALALACVRPSLGRVKPAADGAPARAMRPVVSAFMGAGKSVFIAELARLCALKGYRVVVATPRQKLVRQLGETIQAFIPDTGLVMSGYRQPARVMVACFSSLPQAKAAIDEAGVTVDLLIVDECHGSEAPQHQQSMLALSPRWMVGLTATPFRSDIKQTLSLWDDVVFRYSFGDGLRDGVVTPITPLHWTAACAAHFPADHGPDSTPEAPDVDDAMIAMFRHYGLPGPTLANARSIADADAFASRLTAHGYPAASIHSLLTWAEQCERIEALRTGEIAVLVHVSMLSEGADFPWLAALACRREVRARVRFVQEVGRVCRTHPGKSVGYVFDPLALLAAHGLEHAEALGRAIDEASPDEADDERNPPTEPEDAPPPKAVLLEQVDAWALSVIEGLRQTGRLPPSGAHHLPRMIGELRAGSRAIATQKQWNRIDRIITGRSFGCYPCAATRAALADLITCRDLTKPQASVLMTVLDWIADNVNSFQPWPADLPVPPAPTTKAGKTGKTKESR
jgi:hypothetical protein